MNHEFCVIFLFGSQVNVASFLVHHSLMDESSFFARTRSLRMECTFGFFASETNSTFSLIHWITCSRTNVCQGNLLKSFGYLFSDLWVCSQLNYFSSTSCISWFDSWISCSLWQTVQGCPLRLQHFYLISYEWETWLRTKLHRKWDLMEATCLQKESSSFIERYGQNILSRRWCLH